MDPLLTWRSRESLYPPVTLMDILLPLVVENRMEQEDGFVQYVVFAHWMLCCPVGYVERRGPYLP